MASSEHYSRSILGASDEEKDIYCEPCRKAGHVAIAEGYCVNCPEYLCGQCYNIHRRHKALANHVLLDKGSMPLSSYSKQGMLDIYVEKCPIHPSEVTKFYCETCYKLGCTICVTLIHSRCQKVKHIPDIVQNLDNNEGFKKFDEDIVSTAHKLAIHEEKLKSSDTSNKEMRKLAKQELKHQRAEINKYFDLLEKTMDDQIDAIDKRNNHTLKAAVDRLELMKQDLDQIKNDIEAMKTRQNYEQFIALQRNREKMLTLDDQFDKMRELKIQHYTLLPSELMRTTTEICNMATARLESAIDIQTMNDKIKSSIRSITTMNGFYCVVADNANKSIKVIDTKSKRVVSEVDMEAQYTLSVTSVTDDRIAASLSLSDRRLQIRFFSVSASGVIQSTSQLYNVDDFYMGMVHSSGNIYGFNSDRIDIFNSMTGTIIRTIQTDDKGANLFGYLEGIALSHDGKTIYVTDNEKNSVISMTVEGKIKSIYTDKDLTYPRGITVDKHGYVYVRSTLTCNVHQLTADLNKIQVLIEEVPGDNITYSSSENKLYISVANEIHQYSLDF